MASWSPPIYEASDETFLQECDVCRYMHNKISEAISFCTVCTEYLCDDCDQTHKTLKASRDHKVVTGSKMPCTPHVSKPALPIMYCENHKSMTLNDYCVTHRDVICGTCKLTDHRKCETTDVAEQTKGVKINESFDQACKRLTKLKKNYEKLKTSRQQDRTKVTPEKKGCLDDVQKMRKRINNLFDQLETALTKKATGIEEGMIKEIDNHVTIMEDALDQINDQLNSLNQCRKSQYNDVMFVGMKKADALQQKYEVAITAIEQEIYPIKIEFQPNDLITDMLRQLKSLGSVQTSKGPSNITSFGIDRILSSFQGVGAEEEGELEEGEIVVDDDDGDDDVNMLKYKYAEDQWSPLNPEGKKHYDREFLLQFQFESMATCKPAGLPDIPDIILDKPLTAGRQYSRELSVGSTGSNDAGSFDFTPKYVWTSGGGGRPPKGLPRQPSNQEKEGGGQPLRQINESSSKDIELHKAKEAWKPMVVEKKDVTDDDSKGLPRQPSNQEKEGGGQLLRQINESSSKDIELHKAKEAWKPMAVQKKDVTDDDSKGLPRQPSNQEKEGGGQLLRQINESSSKDIELHKAKEAWKPMVVEKKDVTDDDELYKKTRSILNKLTQQKFQTLVSQIQALPIDSENKLKGVIDLVFEKAISEPNFSVAYANMCRCLSMFKVQSQSKPGEMVNFRAVLLTRCQREFEKDKSAEAGFAEKRKEIEEAEEGPKKEELKVELEYAESKAKRRSLGNIRFIGEIFKLKMLTENIMHDCVFKLLRTKDPENLECFCTLFTTIGKELDTDKAKPRMDQYFTQMGKIVNEKKTSSRVRFMLQDVIDLRLNKWVPRRVDNNPKTIDQIHREVEQEAQEKALLTQQAQHQLKANRGRRGPPGPGGQMGGSGSDSWNAVYTGRTPLKSEDRWIDPSKEKFSKLAWLSPGVVGAAANFDAWGRGSTGGTTGKPSQEKENPSPAPNRVSALSKPEDDSSRRYSGVSPARGEDRGRGGWMGGPDSDGWKTVYTGRTPLKSEDRWMDPSKEKFSKLAWLSPGVVGAANFDAWGRGSTGGTTGRPSQEKEKPSPAPNRVSALSKPEDDSSRRYSGVSPARGEDWGHASWMGGPDSDGWKTVYTGRTPLKSEDRWMDPSKEKFSKLAWLSPGVVGAANFDAWGRGSTGGTTGRPSQEKEKPSPAPNRVSALSKPEDDSSRRYSGVSPARGEDWGHASWMGGPDSDGWKTVYTGRTPLKSEDRWMDPSKEKFSKELEFTKGDSAPSTPTTGLPITEISNKLHELIVVKSTDNVAVFDWIETNVDEPTTKTHQFIRTLMTAVCNSAINGERGKEKVEQKEISSRHDLLQKYLDHQAESELQALYALQALVTKLEHPKGVLRTMFDTFYDEDIISEDAFIQWEKSEEEPEGKGVALKQVVQFFAWLREAEDES